MHHEKRLDAIAESIGSCQPARFFPITLCNVWIVVFIEVYWGWGRMEGGGFMTKVYHPDKFNRIRKPETSNTHHNVDDC